MLAVVDELLFSLVKRSVILSDFICIMTKKLSLFFSFILDYLIQVSGCAEMQSFFAQGKEKKKQREKRKTKNQYQNPIDRKIKNSMRNAK